MREVEANALGTDRVAKSVKAALEYHPFGMNKLGFSDGGWVYGPTFAVKVDEITAALCAIVGETVYIEGDYDDPVKSLLALRDATTTVPLTLDKKGHDKERATTLDKFGQKKESGPSKCTARYMGGRYELAYPLVRLATTMKVAKWEAGPSRVNSEVVGRKNDPLVRLDQAVVTYGFDTDGKMLAIFLPRLATGCVIGERRELLDAATHL